MRYLSHEAASYFEVVRGGEEGDMRRKITRQQALRAYRQRRDHYRVTYLLACRYIFPRTKL